MARFLSGGCGSADFGPAAVASVRNLYGSYSMGYGALQHKYCIAQAKFGLFVYTIDSIAVYSLDVARKTASTSAASIRIHHRWCNALS
jgi:hypothetical protein